MVLQYPAMVAEWVYEGLQIQVAESHEGSLKWARLILITHISYATLEKQHEYSCM